MKRLMILGAGRGQVDLIKAAKKYGYETVVTGIEGNYPGFDYADIKCVADISNPQEVLKAAMEYNIDGIATACLDTGISSLGYVCDELGLPGLSYSAAQMSGNKLLMKNAFMEHGVSTAKYKKITSKEQLANITDELTLPLIVKAVDLQGSRGINIVYTEDELLDCYENTMSESNKDYCIIEEFIEGYEFGAQAFVVNNKVLFILPCGDITFLGKTKVPVGHYSPLILDDDKMKQIYDGVTHAISAIGLNNCAVNVDMILKDEKIYIIELTGRVGANCLPELSSIYYGLDIYKLIIDTAMGKDVTEYFNNNKKDPTFGYAKMMISEQTGELKEIIDNNEDNEDIYVITHFVKPGDEIRKFTNSRDCIGQIVVKGYNLEYCEKLIKEVESKIKYCLDNHLEGESHG